MGKPIWYIKVTSKGQITLPKEIRETMVIKEGDQLQATLGNDSIVLTRREPYSDSEHMRHCLLRQLRESGVDPNAAGDELRAPHARQDIGPVNVDMTSRIRLQREGRDEVLP